MNTSNLILTMAIGFGCTCSLMAADATITVDYNTVVRTLAADFHGVNYVAFWDNSQGSTGSREALRRAGGVKLVRFPGGAPADWYDWANPLADGWSSTSPQITVQYLVGSVDQPKSSGIEVIR